MTDPLVAVGSAASNLAGEREGRPDFLKSHIIGHISSDTPLAVADTIIKAYGKSNTCKMKRFLKWSKTDPGFLSEIGVTSGSLPGGNLDYEAIEPHVPPWDEDEEVSIVWNDTYVGIADPFRWVDEYMSRYHNGEVVDEDYIWTFDSGTQTATITRDGEDPFVLVMPGYYPDQMYMYVYYWASNNTNSYWWIYRYGTGNATLDAMIDSISPVAFGSFYPPIPFRINNKAVYHGAVIPELVALYPVAKEAFYKAYNLRFDDVQERIMDGEQNPNLEDIDYIYAVQAVSFNTPEQAGRKYIFMLVEFLVNNTFNHSPTGKANWFIQYGAGTWPDMTPPWKSIKVESTAGGVGDFRTDLKWSFMNMTTGSGLLKPDAKVDEVWFEVLPDPLVSEPSYYEFKGFNQEVALCWQVTNNSWKRIVVTGLQYNNYVYKTDHTVVTAKQALEETVKDSEFLVHLHEGIFNSMPFIDQIQIGTSSSWLVFNCLEIHKAEWYESDWFKVILVVVILAVSIVAAIVTGGTSLGAGGAAVAGILTGSGLGLTAALIIAAAVDVLAGILISYLIGLIATELFGDKWGPLIGAIVSFVFSFGLNVGSISNALDALKNPETWIALATATGNGVAGYLQGQQLEVAEQTAKMLEQYSEKNAEIQRLYNELNNNGHTGIDLSVINRYTSDLTETPTDFLTRTLVTGGDIVEVTLQQVADFCKNNLKLEV